MCHGGTESPHPTCMLRSYDCSYLTGRRRDWSGGSRRRPLLCSWQPCIVTGCGQGMEGVAGGGSRLGARPSWCAPCAVPRCTCGDTTAASALGLPKTGGNRRHHLAVSHVHRDSDRMMLVFSADQTTNLSLFQTAALSRARPAIANHTDCDC